MAGFDVGVGQLPKANARFSKLSSADHSGSGTSGFTNGCEPILHILVAGISAAGVFFIGSWMAWYEFAGNHCSMAGNGSFDVSVSGRGFSNRSGGSEPVSYLMSGAGAASDIFFAGESKLGSTLAGRKRPHEDKTPWLYFVAVTLQRPCPISANTAVYSQEMLLYFCSSRFLVSLFLEIN